VSADAPPHEATDQIDCLYVGCAAVADIVVVAASVQSAHMPTKGWLLVQPAQATPMGQLFSNNEEMKILN
jgi:hypothetical protein